MDGNARRNAKTSIGEIVSVKKAEVKPAKKVIIAPAHQGVMIKASPLLFKQGLLGKALVKGDLVSLGRTRRRQMDEIESVFSMMEGRIPGFGFGDLKFVVLDAIPKKEIVVVNQDTEVEFNPQAVELKDDESISLGINYEDIGGLGEEIRKVREMIELPLKHPELFEKLGIEPPKGVLLHGPPGTGKTLLAKAVASETNSNFILINGPEVISKFYGESEANLRKKFEEAEQNAPSIIFFDEIDAIATKREETKGDVEKRVVAQLLGLMDGLKSRGKVIVIAATNMPNVLDIALRRPGRFDREIEIGAPSKEGRLEILKIHTRNMPYEAEIRPDAICRQLDAQLNRSFKEKNISEEKLTKEIYSLNEEINRLESKKNELNKTLNIDDKNFIEKILAKISVTNKRIGDLEREIKAIGLTKKKLEELAESFEDKKKLKKVGEECNRIYEKLLLLIVDKNKPLEIILKNHLGGLNDNVKEIIVKLMDKDILGDELRDPNSNFYKNIKRDPESINAEYKDIARITHGFVGADLNALAKEAAMIVLRRILPELKVEGVEDGQEIPKEILEKLMVTQKDFFESLKVVRPSAMREVLVETPDVSWTDIGGLEDVKSKLKEAVEWPLKTPEAFKRMGIRPPRGILLYGPPGTGKTLLAKAVAKESEANFILVNGPSLLSKWVGESEKAVREIFRKARQTAPTILFFDEIDALAPKRSGHSQDSNTTERLVNQMLTEMDGLESLNDVVVIAATNRPDMVDPALLRQGRFDRVILTPVPDQESRKNIFDIYLKRMPLSKDVDAEELASKTEGYVGADIEGVCREAAMIALREDMKAKEVIMEHFVKALDVVKASVDEEIEEAYNQLANYFSSARAKQITEDKHGYVG